jgi:PTS system mannose-specific IIA component
MNAILLVAHAPLAHALREAALHVFAEAAADIAAVDVLAEATPETSLAAVQAALAGLPRKGGVLILADVLGATPCNVAQRLIDGQRTQLVTGVNLPMLLRALTYRHEPLPSMRDKALAGGTQGIMLLPLTAPQDQAQPTPHDPEPDHHQQ